MDEGAASSKRDYRILVPAVVIKAFEAYYVLVWIQEAHTNAYYILVWIKEAHRNDGDG